MQRSGVVPQWSRPKPQRSGGVEFDRYGTSFLFPFLDLSPFSLPVSAFPHKPLKADLFQLGPYLADCQVLARPFATHTRTYACINYANDTVWDL